MESVASPSPFQRFWRHTRGKAAGPGESPSSWSEPSVTAEHASSSLTLSRSASTVTEELEAISPVSTSLITPLEDSKP